MFSPTQLREALCALRQENRVRRALVVVETCFSGVFGEAQYGGLERGCGAAGTPLDGVVLLTAATSTEVSYAGQYDIELEEWVNDAFSAEFATRAASQLTTNVAQFYAATYLRVSGSHASLFNSAAAGRITAVSIGEFLGR